MWENAIGFKYAIHSENIYWVANVHEALGWEQDKQGRYSHEGYSLVRGDRLWYKMIINSVKAVKLRL